MTDEAAARMIRGISGACLAIWLGAGACWAIGAYRSWSETRATSEQVWITHGIPAGEWVQPDIQFGNAVVHRGRVACPLDICPAGQYGYWRLWSKADHPDAPWPLNEKGRFTCGCVKESEAPPPEVFVIEARTFDVPHPGACGVSATCLGVERSYCEGPYQPWCEE